MRDEGIELRWLLAPMLVGFMLFGGLAYALHKAEVRNAENARIAAECKQ
jgi:hypothetical protein